MATDPPLGPSASGLPPSVRIIRAGTNFLAARRRMLAIAVVVGAAIVWLLSGLYQVGNGEQATIRRFGRLVDDTVSPGMHLALPRGVDVVRRGATAEILRLEVTGSGGQPLALVTGDENLVETTLVAQYKITGLGAYLFHVEDPARLLSAAVQAALAEVVATMPVDDLLTSGKAKVQIDVRHRAQQLLDTYGAGLALVAVSLQSVQPPGEAAGAFLQVSDSRSQAARLVNDAETARDSALARARGEAGRLLGEAESAATSRVLAARGAAERFSQVLAQARRSPGQTRTDLYRQMANKVLPRTRIVVLAPGQKPRVDINLVDPATRRP